MDGAKLELRDIHLPAAVSWWPPALGWWLLLALALGLGVAFLLWRRGSATRRLRAAALAELGAIEGAFEHAGDGHACAQALSRLLRRLALLVGDEDTAAGDFARLSAALATLSAGPPPADLAELLGAAPYSPAAAARLEPARYRAATAALRPWLARLRAPARAAHAAV